MKQKFTITEKDYIKAVKKADREREIELHGKVISKTHKSKKEYNRAKEKNKRNNED